MPTTLNANFDLLQFFNLLQSLKSPEANPFSKYVPGNENIGPGDIPFDLKGSKPFNPSQIIENLFSDKNIAGRKGNAAFLGEKYQETNKLANALKLLDADELRKKVALGVFGKGLGKFFNKQKESLTDEELGTLGEKQTNVKGLGDQYYGTKLAPDIITRGQENELKSLNDIGEGDYLHLLNQAKLDQATGLGKQALGLGNKASYLNVGSGDTALRIDENGLPSSGYQGTTHGTEPILKTLTDQKTGQTISYEAGQRGFTNPGKALSFGKIPGSAIDEVRRSGVPGGSLGSLLGGTKDYLYPEQGTGFQGSQPVGLTAPTKATGEQLNVDPSGFGSLLSKGLVNPIVKPVVNPIIDALSKLIPGSGEEVSDTGKGVNPASELEALLNLLKQAKGINRVQRNLNPASLTPSLESPKVQLQKY